MRVAELIAPHRFRLTECPAPDPAPGEVQVRVNSVGICGSDLHYYRDGRIGDTPCEFPMVLGHEPAGTVLRTGAGVTGWASGDRAALEPAVYCYHCHYCRSGRYNICDNIRFLSQPGIPGFFREVVNLPVENLFPLAPGISLRDATLFEPLAVVLHSMQFVSLRPGETAAVFGAGPIGLLTVAVLKLCGASRVWAVDPVAHRRSLASALGAAAVLDPAEGEPARAILADTHQHGVDVAIDCAAQGDSTNQCLRAVRSGGRVVITGITAEDTVSLEFHHMRRKEISLFNVRRSNDESQTALDLLRDQPQRFASMITHVRPLEAIAPAFAMLERYEDGVGKLVISLE